MTKFDKYYKIFDSVGYGRMISVGYLENFLNDQDNPDDYLGLSFNMHDSINGKDLVIVLDSYKKGFGAKFQIDGEETYYLDDNVSLKKDLVDHLKD